MARIVRHPDVRDHFLEIGLSEIEKRGGITDLFEAGKLMIFGDYRLPVDFRAIEALERNIDGVSDQKARRLLKKLKATTFFEGEEPSKRSIFDRSKPSLVFSNPIRQAMFDVLCKGDPKIFNDARRTLKTAHDELLRIFKICFPGYSPFRFIPSLRLTQTLFENLHWDNHSIEDDFQQARLFTNLDQRPRIWHVSHRSDDYMRQIYNEHDLVRFAGKDPNLLLDYITGELMGGTRETWKDTLPRHKIAFDPGEVWSGESRLLSHQIYYGEAAMVFMWFMNTTDMADPANRFNERIAAIHREMGNRGG